MELRERALVTLDTLLTIVFAVLAAPTVLLAIVVMFTKSAMKRGDY